MRRVVLIGCLVSMTVPLSAEEFRYDVRRDKLWGGETGVLTIGEEGVAYASENGETTIELPYQEIRKIDVADRAQVKIWTYERAAKRLTLRRKIEFELLDDAVSDRLPHFLAERLQRPVLGSSSSETPKGVEIAAYHRHMLGGCDGTLVLGADAVHFLGKEPKHDRTWPFEDIETIGSADPFHFRISSYAETYNFDLKERVPEELYRRLWLRVFGTTTNNQPHLNKERDQRSVPSCREALSSRRGTQQPQCVDDYEQ